MSLLLCKLLPLLGRVAAKADQPGLSRCNAGSNWHIRPLSSSRNVPRLVLVLKAEDASQWNA
jgi:hypothetical protein